ncbi:MAG: hypothetical protein Q7J06_11730 [Bacteroidales bacterium]|nr:hypothetical protein [Bacteroidales bacterium]
MYLRTCEVPLKQLQLADSFQHHLDIDQPFDIAKIQYLVSGKLQCMENGK